MYPRASLLALALQVAACSRHVMLYNQPVKHLWHCMWISLQIKVMNPVKYCVHATQWRILSFLSINFYSCYSSLYSMFTPIPSWIEYYDCVHKMILSALTACSSNRQPYIRSINTVTGNLTSDQRFPWRLDSLQIDNVMLHQSPSLIINI